MKKLIILFLILGIFLCNIKIDDKNDKEEVKAVFFSYIELQKYVKNKNIETSKNNIDKVINNVKSMNLNTIILQVRPASDSIYNSKLFPMSSYIVENEGDNFYDVLDYFIKKSHKNNIKVFAWINPYRIRTNNNVNSISKDNPAYKYINTDTIYINNGIYYNPSKQEVIDLVVRGVKEVVNYDIDGLLFDDYFYPDSKIDEKDYNEYLNNNGYISSQEYRLNQVNKLIKKVHKECQKKNISFGIAPEGNIENNYNKNYADVKKWLNSNEYVDFIMPQIYYGFYNSSRDYLSCLYEWENLIKNENIDLYIALAFYKVGQEDKFAKEGIKEWENNDNIIMREILLSRNRKNYKGFSLFRYDNIFNDELYTSTSIQEIENVKKIIK